MLYIIRKVSKSSKKKNARFSVLERAAAQDLLKYQRGFVCPENVFTGAGRNFQVARENFQAWPAQR